MNNYRFCFQENQFWGEPVPCTLALFNQTVDSGIVSWKIATRQAVADAVAKGCDLRPWTYRSDYQQFCLRQELKPRAGETFRQKSEPEKLLQWTEALKESLPCFIFGASGFDLMPVMDKLNNPVVDEQGKPVMRRRRKLEAIHLSGLFMFDADKLTIDPYEVFLRTQVAGFPWRLLLAHKTSSGKGLRLVCEARPELGNIADNQICLGRELHLMSVVGTTGKPVVDDSCIDASRISYAPRRQDIYYINEDNLF
ncbi:MAG: hypothetical protein K6G70_10990 [Bacteroidaceae bacterium]|nr:hypothetical protein [Bacteroidaceae bacterium]